MKTKLSQKKRELNNLFDEIRRVEDEELMLKQMLHKKEDEIDILQNKLDQLDLDKNSVRLLSFMIYEYHNQIISLYNSYTTQDRGSCDELIQISHLNDLIAPLRPLILTKIRY